MPLIIRKHIYLSILFLQILFAIGFIACSPNSLQTAHKTIQQADSLRVIGLTYGDSAQLAQAYDIMEGWKWVYPDEFAHVCYHYGRLLRERDNPVAAMECFINATHTSTHDYHVLGRVYSNMGTICHQARKFDLSYDMYKLSGDMYMRHGDILSYCYDLNNMAFEKAMISDSLATFSLIKNIERYIQDSALTAKIWETKAELFLRIGQYDSAIVAINHLQPLGYMHSTGFVQKAQAFWYSGQLDSALNYATYVLNLPQASEQDKYNVLYICINGYSTLNIDEIKVLSERRADIEAQNLIPQHKMVSVAANLLEQDLKKKPIYIYVLTCCLLILLLFIILWICARHINIAKQHQLKVLQQVKEQYASQTRYKQQEIEQICSAIRHSKNWQYELSWKDYEALCDYFNRHFYLLAHKLKEKYALNEREVRLCLLVFLGGFSDKQLADILCYGENSIRGMKRYTAKKMGTSSAKLRIFMQNLLLNTSTY